MSDQNVISDWSAYFANLRAKHKASGKVDSFPDMTPSFAGSPRSWVTIMRDVKTGVLESFRLDESDEFEAAKAIYESNGKPRLWLFWDLSSAPWRCEAG